MWKHIVLQQHDKELEASQTCLHASPFMEMALYQRKVFSLKCQLFLNRVRSHANVSIENGQMHREPFSYEATQPPARLESPFYGYRHDHLLVKYQMKDMSSEDFSMSWEAC